VTKLASRYVGKNVVFGLASGPIQSTVDIAEPMGSESLIYLKAGTGNLIARIHGEHLFDMGQPLTAQVNMEKSAPVRCRIRKGDSLKINRRRSGVPKRAGPRDFSNPHWGDDTNGYTLGRSWRSGLTLYAICVIIYA
jgi:hypothetical protein